MQKMISSVLIVLAAVLLIGCGKMPEDRLLAKGRKLEEKQNFKEAAAVYEKIATKFPKSPLADKALYQSGLVYANGMQDYPKAIEAFRKVTEAYPDCTAASRSQFMIGFIYANSAVDTAKARIAYQTFLKKYPNHELVPSVEWELKYLGKDINDLTQLGDLKSQSSETGIKK